MDKSTGFKTQPKTPEIASANRRVKSAPAPPTAQAAGMTERFPFGPSTRPEATRQPGPSTPFPS